MKKTLITGGLGFIGSNLASKCIEEGQGVTILSKSNKRLKNIKEIKNQVNIKYKDIRGINREDIQDKDYIFHLASTVDNYNINSNPYLDIEVNCDGTIALLEACKQHNPNARIVYASTFFVNGNIESLPATSDSPCNPQGLYPATRLAGEHFCKIYNQIFGLNSVISRCTNVFGIHEEGDNKKKAAFNYLIKLATEDKDIPIYGDGSFVRDYIYVEDAVSGLLKIAEKGERSEIYYVGRGEGTKFSDLIDIVIKEAQTGRKKYIPIPKFHKQTGIGNYYCDNSKLRGLGWEPKISLREGIRRTIEFYKNG